MVFVFRPRIILNTFLRVLFWFSAFILFFAVNKVGAVEASVIVAAIEGDVSTILIKDDFKVSLDASSVGKKIDANSVILTGKSASASLLFSNGVLITIKSGSRFFLKKYSQKNFKDTSNSKPSELEEEPSVRITCPFRFRRPYC